MGSQHPHIVFICQPGEFEIKSLLLAYSLYKKGIGNLHAGIPAMVYNHISVSTFQLFEKLGVHVFKFENAFIENRNKILRGDWMSNKHYALQKLNLSEHLLFLDSDIVCKGYMEQFNQEYQLAAKPVDVSPNFDLEQLVRKAGITPTGKTTVSTIDTRQTLPYFNSGVLWINKKSAASIINAWQKYFHWLSQENILYSGSFDIFHRDQIALCMATEALKINFTELEESLNFPARRRNKIPSGVILAHYHDIYSIYKHPELMRVFNDFVQEFSDFRKVVERDFSWTLLANKQFRRLGWYKKSKALKNKLTTLLR